MENLVENIAMSTMNQGGTDKTFQQITSTVAIQLYPSTNITAQQDSDVKNNLPTIDNSDCENLIRKNHNITKHLFIQKVSYSGNLNNASLSLKGSNTTTDIQAAGSSVTFRMFNPDTKIEYNITNECANLTVTVKIPLPKNSKIDPIMARKFRKSGINILNQSDSFFNNRCKTYINETTGLLLTIGERKSLFFKNQTSSCSPGCNFEGMDKNNYSICNCKKSSAITANVLSVAFEAFTSINFNIVLCMYAVSQSVIFSLNFRII